MHRHPEQRDRIAARAKSLDVEPFLVLMAYAIRELSPDLSARVRSGSLDIFAANELCVPLFWRLVEQVTQGQVAASD